MAERDVQQAIRLALGRLPDVVLWRNSTGVARPNDRVVRYGLCVGSSDLIGLLAPSGRFLALEVKTAAGRTSLEQDQFLALVRRRGGFACVVRSVAEALAAIDRAREGAVS
jgi:hypothetical protein